MRTWRAQTSNLHNGMLSCFFIGTSTCLSLSIASARTRVKSFHRPPLEHAGHAQVLIKVRPMNAHRHDLVTGSLCSRCGQQARIPRQRCGDATPVAQRDDKLGRRERDRLRTQISNLNFQSAHAMHPTGLCGCPADTGLYRRFREPGTRHSGRCSGHAARTWLPCRRYGHEHAAAHCPHLSKRMPDTVPSAV